MDCPECKNQLFDHEISVTIAEVDAVMINIECILCGKKLFAIVSPDDFCDDVE
jgi:hypothetical protein